MLPLLAAYRLPARSRRALTARWLQQPEGMPSCESFRDLKVWQRASVSIPCNIGEGKRRKRQRVFLHHLDIALGSQREVEVQLEIARRVGLLELPDYERIQEIVEEVGRMLNGLIGSMRE